MACQPMSGHHLRFRPSRKCSKLIISAALPPRSRAYPAPQIRFDWPTRTLSLRPWRVFQIVIIIKYLHNGMIWRKNVNRRERHAPRGLAHADLLEQNYGNNGRRCKQRFFRRFKQLGKKSLNGHATVVGGHATVS